MKTSKRKSGIIVAGSLSCIMAIFFAMVSGGLVGCKLSVSGPPDSVAISKTDTGVVPKTDTTIISGIVEDSMGLPVPGAAVEIVRVNEGVVVSDTTNSDGEVSFAGDFAHPEKLIIRAQHPDFRPFSQNLAVAINAAANPQSLRLRLEPAEGRCVNIPVEVVYQKERGNIYYVATGAEIRLFSEGKLRSKAILDSSCVEFTSLPVGAFRIEITKPGFRLGDDDFTITECGIYRITFHIYPE
ncbi:MAG: carboxypeptidase regulatory-like domain-containing protein [Chlorobi bacterium]|nr:MAG: hypothetical protein UZ07_CHB004000471 [Chlorobi bacterium OLB7]MBK8911818.1 carboxypeptidase regulatory-like domain-containing protein [Chlorobiota bacterium]MBX7218064.1 carboxypeptidase regulatory-like domain-containing protein [Candidatus Kapabacteria bacterium]